VRRKWPLR